MTDLKSKFVNKDTVVAEASARRINYGSPISLGCWSVAYMEKAGAKRLKDGMVTYLDHGRPVEDK